MPVTPCPDHPTFDVQDCTRILRRISGERSRRAASSHRASFLHAGLVKRTSKFSLLSRTPSKQTLNVRKISQHTKDSSAQEESSRGRSKEDTGVGTKLPPLKREINVIRTSRKSVSRIDDRPGPLPELSHSANYTYHSRLSHKSRHEDNSIVAGQLLPTSLTPRIHQHKTRVLRNSELSDMVFGEYERHRGLSSSEYASKCLLLATNFKDKPWLHRIRQASTIATKGVQRIMGGKTHVFQSLS